VKLTVFGAFGRIVTEPPSGRANPNWSKANDGISLVSPYDVRIAILPSPAGSNTIPTRGEKLSSLSFQYPSPSGPPGSPRKSVPAGALTNRVLLTLLISASSDR
jgi:hypothetical protein